ncbi:MAG: flagellar filament capping protein FliD [Defluviitaleaceae bacterium]|nr:flagellar filament capping protein FliD [Defluviitaleaceae bacterium]
MNSSPMRFTGLTSGMDTQAMVNNLMRAENMRMERLTRRRTMIQWRQESLRSVITRTNDFRTQNLDFLREGSITNPNTWNTMRGSITNTGTGGTNGISVHAGANSQVGNFNIRVAQAAQGDTIRGDVDHGGNLNTSHSIRTILAHDVDFSAGYTHLQVNGRAIRINSTDSIQQVMERVNNSEAGVTMRFDSMRGNFVMESSNTGANAVIRTGGDTNGWGVLQAMGLAGVRTGAGGGVHTAQMGTSFFRPDITADSNVFDALNITGADLDTPININIAGTNVTLDQNSTFLSMTSAVNAADNGVSMNFEGGRFVLRRNQGFTGTIEIGGNSDLLNFMGWEAGTIGNFAHTHGTTFNVSDIAGLSVDTRLGDIGYPSPAITGSTFFTIAGHQIPIDEDTTLGELWTAINGPGSGMTATLNENGTINIRASANDGSLPEITDAITMSLLGAMGINVSTLNIGIYDANNNNNNPFNIPPIVSGINVNEQTTLSGLAMINLGDPFSAAHVGLGIDFTGASTETETGPRFIDINLGTLATNAPYTFRVFETDTISSLTTRFNNRQAGMRLDFVASTGSFQVTPTGEGDNARIHVGPGPNTEHGNRVLEGLGLSNIISWDGNAQDDRIVQRARNAVVYYDPAGTSGTPLRIEQASNRFEMHGVTITLTREMNATIEEHGAQTFTVGAERNVDDAVEAVRNFIEQYNDFIRHINSLHTTARPRAGNSNRGPFFEPLTDEQRQGMSDREIERWEEQARTGLLHRDRDMRNMHAQIRQAMFGAVRLSDGSEISLFNVGITTVGRDGAPGDQLIGVLQIDEDRLRRALEQDPQRVQQLFARTGEDAGMTDRVTIEQRNARAPHVGVGNRLEDLLRTFGEDDRGSLRQRAGYIRGLNISENIMSRQLRDYDRRMDQMQQHLLRRENHFFAMFARMETAMAQAHSQMDSLFAFGQG